MKNPSINREPSLIICVHNSKLQNTVVKIAESTNFSSVYLSTYTKLLGDIQSRNSMSIIIEFTNNNDDNLYFLNHIKKRFPQIDIFVVYSADTSGTKTRDFRLKTLEHGANDCIKYPEEIKFLEIRIENSYKKQFSQLELNTNLDFWNTISKAVNSIIENLYGKTFFKRLLIESVEITKSDLGSLVILDGKKPSHTFSWNGNNLSVDDKPEIEISEETYNLELQDYFILLEDEQLLNHSNLPLIFNKLTLGSYLYFPIYNTNKDIIGFLELYKSSSNFDTNLFTPIIKIILETLPFEDIYWEEPTEEVSDGEFSTEEYYLSIVDNTPLPILIIKDDLILFINKTASRILGYEKRKLINTDFSSISPTHFNKGNIDGESNDTKTTELITLDLKKRNGDIVTLEGNMRIVTHMNSSAFLLIFKKPQEQEKKASNSSDSSEALRLAAAVKSLKSAVTITDLEKNIVYVNPAHKNIFGYEPQELIGNPGNILFSINDPSGISDKIYDAIVAIGWEGERISIRKNGDVFPSYEKISVVKDQDGNPLGIVSTIDEITERKRLEQALKESEERYRTLVETASTAIIALDEKGKIILYNPSAENIFLYSKPELADKTFLSLIDEIDENLSYLDNLTGTTTELYGVNKNGDKFPIEITLSKCIIEGKNIYTGIILDITERKDLQNQLIQSARLAAIGELISGVTHEVKNPIAVVMGYSEMLLGEERIDEETKKIIKIIYSESERAGKVLQNMLSFASQNTPNKKPVILNNIIDMTLELADFDLRKNTIQVIKDFDDSLPSILGESNQLKQVFLNILINAQQAISDKDSEGTITIETSEEISGEQNNGNGFVRVQLSDTGGGIPKEILNRIFDPFFTTKPEGVGTGLGLSVSLGIIKDHGGNIEVKSVENEGTSFDIRFPLHKTD